MKKEIIMGCCDNPTELFKIMRNDFLRIQEQYGNLIRDLFRDDPEKIMLKQLNVANTSLKVLATFNAHYDTVKNMQ